SVLRLAHDRLAQALAYELTARERRSAARLIEERARTRRPLAYLLKEAWLGDHRFYVDGRVIVPRSVIAELLRDRLSPWLPRSTAGGTVGISHGGSCLRQGHFCGREDCTWWRSATIAAGWSGRFRAFRSSGRRLAPGTIACLSWAGTSCGHSLARSTVIGQS